jgi:adenine-specific DNA glycosylase
MYAVEPLLYWARDHWSDRELPWRVQGEPHVRRVLVEGLLAQTRAETVAAAYGNIFGNVFDARQWLWGEGRDLRMGHVALLGLPKLKGAALDSLARWMDAGGSIRHLAGPGIGPYTQGMVALLEGDEAAPVDCNVERVAARVDPTVSAIVWIGEVLGTAMKYHISPLAEFPVGYVAISAVLDIGATRCAIGEAPRCAGCPLEMVCAFADHGPRQMEMWR